MDSPRGRRADETMHLEMCRLGLDSAAAATWTFSRARLRYSDLAVAVSQWLASRRGREKPSPAAVLKALRENDVAGFAFGYGRNATAS